MGRGRGNRHTSPEEYIAKKTQKLGKCLAPTGDEKRKEDYLLEVLAAMECGGRPQLHDRVRVIQGEKWVGYVGVVVHDVQDNRPFKIRLLYGPPTTVVGWFTHADLIKWDNPEKLCEAIDSAVSLAEANGVLRPQIESAISKSSWLRKLIFEQPLRDALFQAEAVISRYSLRYAASSQSSTKWDIKTSIHDAEEALRAALANSMPQTSWRPQASSLCGLDLNNRVAAMELIKSCEEMCHELRARLVCKGLRLLIELAEALVHGDLLCENRPSAIRRQLKDIRPAIGDHVVVRVPGGNCLGELYHGDVDRPPFMVRLDDGSMTPFLNADWVLCCPQASSILAQIDELAALISDRSHAALLSDWPQMISARVLLADARDAASEVSRSDAMRELEHALISSMSLRCCRSEAPRAVYNIYMADQDLSGRSASAKTDTCAFPVGTLVRMKATTRRALPDALPGPTVGRVERVDRIRVDERAEESCACADRDVIILEDRIGLTRIRIRWPGITHWDYWAITVRFKSLDTPDLSWTQRLNASDVEFVATGFSHRLQSALSKATAVEARGTLLDRVRARLEELCELEHARAELLTQCERAVGETELSAALVHIEGEKRRVDGLWEEDETAEYRRRLGELLAVSLDAALDKMGAIDSPSFGATPNVNLDHLEEAVRTATAAEVTVAAGVNEPFSRLLRRAKTWVIEERAEQVRRQARLKEGITGDLPPMPCEFLCPISLEVMMDPVVAADGAFYERDAIERHFRSSRRSPMTNEYLRHTGVTAVPQLKSLIFEWRAKEHDRILSTLAAVSKAMGSMPLKHGSPEPVYQALQTETTPARQHRLASRPTKCKSALNPHAASFVPSLARQQSTFAAETQ